MTDDIQEIKFNNFEDRLTSNEGPVRIVDKINAINDYNEIIAINIQVFFC